MDSSSPRRCRGGLHPPIGPSGGRSATSVWFPRAGDVELRREPLPEVGPDEVRVRAVASALSHGTEMLVYRGQVPAELDRKSTRLNPVTVKSRMPSSA